MDAPASPPKDDNDQRGIIYAIGVTLGCTAGYVIFTALCLLGIHLFIRIRQVEGLLTGETFQLGLVGFAMSLVLIFGLTHWGAGIRIGPQDEVPGRKVVLLGLGGALGVYLLSSLAGLVFQSFTDTPAHYPEHLRQARSAPLIIPVLSVGLLGPIAEELFFRRIIFSHLRARVGLPAGIILSTLAFTIGTLQVTPVGILRHLLAGPLLAGLYEYSRGLGAPLVAHIGANLISLLVFYGAQPG